MASSDDVGTLWYADSVPWQELTDDVLLTIFSFLDTKSLVSASKTCKHWYRLADDDSLWKGLLLSKIGEPDLIQKAINKVEKHDKLEERPTHGRWRAEYIRMEDEAPLVLSETLEGHTDEIYHINFSPSGRFFSTTGRDASVRVWNFGYPCSLYAENTDLDSVLVYTRFSDFNQSETMLLVAGIASYLLGADSCILILSLKGLQILYAVSGSNANFRGCWLDDRSFLNGTHIFTSFGQRRFLIKKHTVHQHKKTDQNIQNLISKCDDAGQQLMLLQPYCRNNDFARIAYLPKKCLPHPITPSSNATTPFSEQFDFIDSEQPDEERAGSLSGNSDELRPDLPSHDSESPSVSVVEDVYPVLILANNTKEYPSTGYLSFYKIPALSDTDKEYETCKNFHTADAGSPGGMVGVRLSADNRYIAFNYRSCTKDHEDDQYDFGCYVNEMELKVYDLHNMCFTDIVYKGHSASSSDHLSYIFPAVSDHYLASGSELEKGYLWDRQFGNILGEFEHAAQPGNGGVNASVFHPNTEQVLFTLGDDRKIKVWRSKSLLRNIRHSRVTGTIVNLKNKKKSEHAPERNTSTSPDFNFDRGIDHTDGVRREQDMMEEEVVTCCVVKRKSQKVKKVS